MNVKLKPKALQQLRNSPEVVAQLESIARSVASAAGEGMEVKEAETTNRPSGRARVAVFTSTFTAMVREARTRALTRALDAGRR